MPRHPSLRRAVAAAAFAVLASPSFATVIPSEKDHAVSLDGTWRFKIEQPGGDLGAKPTVGGQPHAIVTPKNPEPFHTTDYREDGSWKDIPVPANWEMQGHSVATYNQPDNAIGLYRLQFDVPAAWEGRVVKVNFDGVQNGAEIYLNGQPVKVDDPSEDRPNFHQGGNTAFQVDLTPAIKFGQKNLLAVRVYKNTKAVDLDSGDFFFLGGIHRPVTLFAVPKSHIADYKVETKLLPGDKAELKVIVEKSDAAGANPTISLEGVPGDVQVSSDKSNRVILMQILDKPKLWSAEHPNLYTLNLDLKSADGTVVEHVSKKIGVREVAIRDGVLLVNNVPVKFTGICRHEVFPNLGTALNAEAWRKDITLMKAANINAIRTSHYPYGSGFYDLCDELGMYVMDEMAAGWVATDTPETFPAWAQHAREMIRRDKNHPSIVVWAVGNENKPGPANKVAADEMKKLDETRPRLVSWRDAEEAGVELDDRHYTNPKEVAKANKMPRRAKIPITYLENPNNWEGRNGSDWGVFDRWAPVLDRVWKETWTAEHIPGQFLWEWQDRAVCDTFPTHLYDFDPATGVNLVKVKGICDVFRNPRPWYYHVKMAYAPVSVDLKPAVSGSTVNVHATNRYSFTDLNELTTTWRLMRGDKELATGNTHAALAPLSQGDIRLNVPGDTLSAADVLRVTFTHPDKREIATYDLRPKERADTTPAMDSSKLSGVTFPRLNLTTVTFPQNEIKWRRVSRGHVSLANITVQKAGGAKSPVAVADAAALYAMPLADVASMDADLYLSARIHHTNPGMPPQPPAVTGDLDQLSSGHSADAAIAGHVHVEYANGQFTYNVKWSHQGEPKGDAKGAGKGDAKGATDVQELGWVFTQPASADQFSWDRRAYWSYYPADHIGRPHGTATPESAKDQYASKTTRPDAFDYNSTKFDCNWVSLADAAGHGLAVAFTPDVPHHCRAETAKDGSRVLVVDLFNSPPRDISSGCVPDYYYTLNRGQQAKGSFRVGTLAGK